MPNTPTSTLPETNSSHPKMDGWNEFVSFWDSANFQVRTVSFREGLIQWKLEISMMILYSLSLGEEKYTAVETNIEYVISALLRCDPRNIDID